MLKTSARNALPGKVTKVTPGAVNAEVAIDIGGGAEIDSIITLKSAGELGLAPGKPVTAIIKSNFVVLLADGDRVRTSARNQIAGKVAQVTDGAVNSEVEVDIGGGRTLVASITKESAHELGLRVGQPVAALIKSPHVIIGVE